MSPPGGVDEPTNEYPSFAADRAGPPPAAPPPAAPPPAAPPPAAPAPTGADPAPPQAPRRFGVWRLFTLVAVALVLLGSALVGARMMDALPGFDNPFAERRTDRSQPVLLQSMRDLSRYVAADGTFQVIVDLQQERANVPDLLLNRRTLFVGVGTVEAYVDFTALADGAVALNADNTAATITLPAPQLGPAVLDLQKSYVVAEQRGLLNRISDALRGAPEQQQQRVYASAQERITAAARESGLAQRAQENTRRMLEGLLRSLGYTTVTITFAAA